MEFCSIASGSTGNCIYIGSNSSSVLVDAGISGKKVEEGLNSFDHTAKDLKGILVTHGIPTTSKGSGFWRGSTIFPSMRRPEPWKSDRSTSTRKTGPELLHEIPCGRTFSDRDLDILPFRISHDAAEPAWLTRWPTRGIRWLAMYGPGVIMRLYHRAPERT